MKIASLLQTQQVTTATSKDKPTEQETKTTAQLETYTPSERTPLSGYSAKEVKTITRNTFTQPNWDLIPTKGMPTPSQEELVAQIQDLARNMPDKKTGTDQEWDAFWSQKYRLMTQYESAVSPDRKALHAQALKVAKKVEEEQPKHVRPLTLVDYLILDDLDLTLDPESQQLMQNTTITPMHRTGGGYDYQVHYGGELVMMSTYGEWGAVLTKAELARRDEFERIFEKAQQAGK